MLSNIQLSRGSKMKKSYTSKDVRVLGEIEHIQLNPSMYIGEVNTPTHLLEECLDNALDEALVGMPLSLLYQ